MYESALYRGEFLRILKGNIMAQFSNISRSIGLIAAASMVASGAMASPIATKSAIRTSEIASQIGHWDSSDINAHNHRRYRDYERTDVGDVIAGVLILGTIAAVASAANKERREPPRSYPQPYPQQRSSSYNSSNQSINGAINNCVSQIERDVRVAEVSSVSRSGPGWLVTGRIYNGDGFICDVDQYGRIANVSFNRAQASYRGDDVRREPTAQAEPYPAEAYPAAGEPRADNQWSDEDYARLREREAQASATAPANTDYSG